MQLLKETKAIAMTRDRIDLPLGGDRALVFRRDAAPEVVGAGAKAGGR